MSDLNQIWNRWTKSTKVPQYQISRKAVRCGQMCEVNREILATLIANAWKMKMESPFAIS
jgi:hypothetical protein